MGAGGPTAAPTLGCCCCCTEIHGLLQLVKRQAFTLPIAQAQPIDFSPFDRVRVLSEALPYLQRFRNKTIVIK